jgi:hypothetical protein
LDNRTDYIDSVTFENVAVDTPIVFLLNKKRITLKNDNILYIEGNNIDQLDVHMNNSPEVPAVVVNQSLSAGNGYIIYDLTTDSPQTDYIRIINRGISTASFKLNLNNMLFETDADVLNKLQAMQDDYANEPVERKVWRFIPNNSYHWYPLSDYFWISSSPALFFNSIGFGFCYTFAELYCQLMTSLGYQARIWYLNGQHTVPEVLINSKWEMYDPDLEVYYFNYQGEVASVEELAAHPDLITNPINPLPGAYSTAYTQYVADIYSSLNTIYSRFQDWYNNNPNYLLNVQIPSGGFFEFPAVFAAPIHITYYNYFLGEAPSYTNARLTIPRGWTGTLNTPLVIHSMGYEGPHTLSVVARDSVGNYQTAPTVANWSTDSWAPITTPSQPNVTDPVTLTVNEPATVYYTLDGNTPTTGEVYLEPPPPVTAVTLTMDKTSPQVQGTVVTFTATASGGSGTYEYIFGLRNPSGQWSVGQAYSSNPSWIWNTAGAAPGTYMVQVLARSVGSTAWYEAMDYVIYTINPPRVTLTMDKTSPQVQGTVITFTATASGGSGTYEYIFGLRNPSGQWSVGQAYSSNPSWIWNTAGIDTGTYIIQVWERSAGSTAAYEAYKSITYTIYPTDYPLNLLARTYGTGTEPVYYAFVQDAYVACSNGYVIDILALDIYENLYFDLPLSVTLRGGYDINWTDNALYTTINGTLTISSGTIVVENIVIQ